MKKEKLLAGSRKKGQEAANEQDEKRRKLDPTSPKTSAQVSGLTADQKKLVEQFKLMSPAEIAALPKEVQENVNLLRQRLGA
jgi:hypothetical protein